MNIVCCYFVKVSEDIHFLLHLELVVITSTGMKGMVMSGEGEMSFVMGHLRRTVHVKVRQVRSSLRS